MSPIGVVCPLGRLLLGGICRTRSSASDDLGDFVTREYALSPQRVRDGLDVRPLLDHEPEYLPPGPLEAGHYLRGVRVAG